MINDRIRQARLLRGMTLEALALQMGDITKQALSKYEKGLVTPSSTRLLQLSRALDMSPEYFFRAHSVVLAPLEFRKLARMPRYRQVQVEEQMREYLERYIALEACFDPLDILTSTTPAQMIPVTCADEAEQAAQALREFWGIGGDPVSHLSEQLEEHGIKVVMLKGPDDFDGACAATRDGHHVLIALNSERPGERIRFTAAHELGHWVMRLPEAMPERDKENCCHRFAGAFLYPAKCVIGDFGHHPRSKVHPRELLIAKRQYGLSMHAALRRLKDLNLLSENGYKSLIIRFSANGWRKSEPEPMPCRAPHRFESLVFWGYAEGLITQSRAAEFLRKPVTALDPNFLGSLESA
ncbi:helix-turn-helix domain-containing protein [Pseudomonas gingeri]|uniref:ImmA/IrrE family metallo-endopeptidase n=1 Tax=Pseudomonas gingeri TaxID=117681 RepID=A0A7Y7YDX6_9PSED|nr:XRE family transcriptional regulator [Pseudomonas gingeri]NWB28367.1 ImmA/IrrE family metallo-endopeptidase [Pseudomonas gingeri]NWC34706.1 ImmA/IrrE family metallo-endopeptidase [Pseudomonas gingeri]NWE24499.1 ImmA/IrrE family metallo-endopeptidase [Pseudomonas gingeri]NWE97762.1 ImmA/IrrE family metallo-endopeptidase [Pseudomonas gingeri]